MRARVMRVSGLTTAAIVFLTTGSMVFADDSASRNMPVPQLTGAGLTDLPTPDIREVIRRQLDAIQSRNADAAYALTTNDFHNKFDNASKFLSHVRFEYRAIYNHDSYRFIDSDGADKAGTQAVRIHDRYGGDPVTVIFRMELQPDGQWLIDGVTVLDAEDAQPI